MSYSDKDGLPSTRIYRMIQDRKGNMWFATSRGLSKFDGSRFTNFTYENGLTNQDVWELAVDDENRVWFFSKSVSQGYVQDDKVHLFPNLENDVLSPNIFYQFSKEMILDTNGRYYRLRNKVWQNLPVDSLFLKKIKTEKYVSLWHPFYNELAMLKPNILELTDQNGNVKTYKSERKQPPLSGFKRGAINDNILYVMTDIGISIIDFKNGKEKFLSAEKFFGTKLLHPAVKFDWVNGKFHLSSRAHLYVLDENFEPTAHFQFTDRFPNNLNSYLDKYGNFWYNNESGLVFESAEQRKAGHFLKEKRIFSIGQTDGELYASGGSDGFYQYNISDRTFHHLDFVKGGAYRIRNGYLITDKEIWEKTNNHWQLVKWIDKNPKYTAYKDFFRFREQMFVIYSHALEVCNADGTLDKIIPKTGLSRGIVYKNQLYFGGGNGLFLYRNRELVSVFGEKFNYPAISFLEVGGKLLIGTDGLGIYSFDGKTIRRIPVTKGLVVHKMIKKQNEDVVFFSSQKGVKKLRLKGNHYEKSDIPDTYSVVDGLISDNVNDIEMQGNLLYTATDFGISSIDISDSRLYRSVPVVFGSLRDSLVVSPENRNNIVIPFSAEDFSRGNSARFYYRIIPTHLFHNNREEWLELTEKQVVFSHLSHGTYILEVKSETLHSAESVSKLTIIVQPTWYEKGWVKMLGILFFLLVSGLIFRKVFRNVKRNAEKKAENNRRYSELQLLALRSQMNTHFVHNSLNAIQYYIQRNDVEMSENYLTKFSKLIRMFFEYSSMQNISLQNEIELLENYLLIEKMRFEDKITYEIICNSELKAENPQIPSMILQPIVENAVNHGIFHKKDGGKITVTFSKQDKHTLEVRVDDDGIGYKKAMALNSHRSESERRSSKVLRERIELLNQSGQRIDYKITDKNTSDESQTGTLVVLRILI